MSERQGRILVVDDDDDVRTAARLLLKRHFASVEVLAGPEELPERLARESFDAILLDMNFATGRISGREGLDWLQRIREIDGDAVVVLMTAYGDAGLAVEAIKHGATDFVLKPWQNEKLIATLTSAVSLRQSRDEVGRLKERQSELAVPATDLIAQSAAMAQVMRLVAKAAPSDASVLILGENGTGKEVIAREIWRQSSRADEVFLGVDLGSVPETLFESELFGHVKGAFTDARADRMGRFQAASGGTLFLDEIGNLPLHLQAKLLRVLESREVVPVGSDRPVPVDVRLLCATNSDLESAAEQGAFRPDLLYRINTVQVELPPLRSRPEDIAPLVKHFLSRYAHKYGRSGLDVSSDALGRLKDYHWPGNVRELAHAVERALILSESTTLVAEDFALSVRSQSKGQQGLRFESLNLEEVEGQVIAFVLAKHEGNVSRAARELGITRTSLYRRIEKYGL
ncbi:MAG: sigma-54 dependent transcriptional regulator [Xanthomonadales bacterium]|nr:sigma-54 dependent transcriptional regulator [Xanthomonadales bacterium]